MNTPQNLTSLVPIQSIESWQVRILFISSQYSQSSASTYVLNPSFLTEDEAVPGLKASDSSVNPTAPHTSIPQISEPTTVSESKNIDLNLVSSIPEATEAGSSTIAKETQDTTKEISKLDTKPPAEGMSATSGPLSDDLVAGYGGSPVEKHMRAAHAEKRAQMAETGEGPTTAAEESQV